MSEENNRIEDNDPPETESAAHESSAQSRYFTRRNAGILLGLTAILGVLLAILVTVSYRYGVFDNYIKQQFVAKMAEIGIVFDADVFRVTVAPLSLELKNATFNDKVSGEKLFFVRDARLGLSIQNLYAWQLSRDISLDSTDVNGAEVWVKFDENGKSNFSNLTIVEDQAGSRVNFKYDSVKFSLQDGLIHFGDVQHKISADAKNVTLALDPTTYAVPDEQKRYNFNLASTDSNFVYDGSPITPIDLRVKGIADDQGAEISELNLKTPIGESALNGKLTDWKNLQYDLNITSSVDLTQTSNLLPIGTPLRGVGNFSGKVTGAGDNYKVEGEITSESLSAANVYLKALNVAATIQGTNSMYEANGTAIAELLTFEDFRIEFPKISGNVRGSGSDFKWLGELQAVSAKSPLGSLGGLFVSDAVADYKDEQLSATLGSVRTNTFTSPDVSAGNLQAQNIKINSKGGVTDVSAPALRAASVKSPDFNLRGVTAGNIRIKDRPQDTQIQAGRVQIQNADAAGAKLGNLNASGISVVKKGSNTDVTAQNFTAERVETNGANIAGITATDVDIKDSAAETIVYADGLRVAKVTTDAAILGTLNVAGVRLTVRQGRIEGTSGDINAGNIALTKAAVPQGGNLENVKILKPVFVVEPSGRYRASADMSLGGGVVGSVTLGAARASVTAENDAVALKNLTANVMNGNVSGDATIALRNNRRSQINAAFTSLDLGKLLALQGGQIIPLEGETTGSVNLSFNGTNFKTASGSLNADITANAGNAERGLIPLTGKVAATAANGLFSIQTARLNTEKTEFSANGQFDLNGYDSNLNIALNSTDAGEIERIVKVLNLSPELEQQTEAFNVQFAGNLNFSGTVTGNLTDPNVEGRASVDSILLKGRNVGSIALGVSVTPERIAVADAKFQEADGGGSAVFNLDVPRAGTNNITVRAAIDGINTGTILSVLPISLPAEIRSLNAKTSGTINVSGAPGALQGAADISSGAGTINGQPFDGFSARANFQGNTVTLDSFEAKFGDGALRASGTYATDTTNFNFNVEGANIALARIRPFIPNSQNLPDFSGTVDLTAKAVGTASDSSSYDINFSGAGRNIAFAGKSIGAATFAGVTDNRQLNANLTVNFNNQPQTVTASVNFADPNLPFRAETAFNNTELAPFIALAREQGENDVDITGTATGRVFLAGNLSSLDAAGSRVFSTDNLSGAAEFTQLALQIGETPLAAVQPVSVTFNPREIVINNAKFAGGGSDLTINGVKALTDAGMNNLAVDGNINLSIFNALSKDTFFAGLANVSVRLTGVNTSARLNGVADLKNISVASFISSERITFERINGRILFTTNQVQIDDLNGFLGGGKISASGGASLEGLELQRFRFIARGTNITAPLPTDFITTGDADFEFSGFRQNGELNSLIRGTLLAKRTIYTKDIDLADVLSGRSRDTLSQSAGSGSSFIGVPKLDITVEGRDALVVRNNIADVTASASLRLTGDVDFPQITGRISATSGTILFRNDRYEIQRGELTFPPNTEIEPFINLQAEAEIRGYQVIVSLVGELSNTENLNATVRSNPALPQADVISLITTGNLANTDTGIPTLAQSGLNTAAELITDSLINNPARKATDRLFGLNVFEIDPIISGQRLNASARLTVGRRINRNLQVTYSTNLSQDQQQVLALEYRVSNRLSFVAQYEQRSLSNVTQRDNAFSFEVKLRKRF